MAKANSETVVVASWTDSRARGAGSRPAAPFRPTPHRGGACTGRRWALSSATLGPHELRVRFELLRLLSRRARLQVPLQAFHAVWYAEKLACYADRVCRSLLAETINFTRDLVDALHEKLG
jgi:hypothetical protein